MHLYNVTLQKPTAITHALLGNFSGGKQQEILLCRGQSILELVRVDADTGKLQTLVSHNVFGIVRSLSAVKLTGSMKGIFHPLLIFFPFILFASL
jgi:splicing factor 3B subunit 3